MEKVTKDQIIEAFNINVFSQLELTRKLLPALRAAKGRVIATTSGLAHIPLASWLGYCRYP